MRKGIAFLVAFALLFSQFVGFTPSFALTGITVTVLNAASTNDVAIGEISKYTIAFELGAAINIGDYIKVKFPSGTSFVNSTLDKAYLTVNGSNPTVNPTTSGTIASIVSPLAVGSGATVTIVFTLDAGVKNPSSQSGKYQLQVGTFAGPNGTTAIENYDAYSSYYYIGYRAKVTIQTSNDPNLDLNYKEFVTWTIKWKTGNQGKLTAGTDTVTLDFQGNNYLFPKPEGCFADGFGGYYIPAT